MYFRDTRSVIKYCKKYIEGTVLDFGCGDAKYKEIIEESADEYLGMDMSKAGEVDIVGDIENAPLENDSVDTIICTQVLEHTKNPFKVVSEISRILRKNGICIITAPFICAYHPHPLDCFRFTPEGLRQLCIQHNLKVIETHKTGKIYSVLYQLMRFSLFNPYKPSRRGTYRINHALESISNFFNRFTSNEIIFTGSVVIARKE